MADRRALVTGATGYIGARLAPALLREGWTVRVLTRDAGKLADRTWHDQVEVVEGSADEPDDLTRAMEGVQVAYYLIHSMDGSAGFVERDREMAHRFAGSAERAGLSRIVYLSGLYPPDTDLSAHLGSRKQVEDIFLAGAVPTVVLRAAVIVGSGSASFEMLRHLTERLPVMVAPQWLNTRIQPIAIGHVLHYLVAAAELPAEVDRGFDIGGEEVFTYRDMINRYAAVTGLLRRRVRTIPVMTPWLASHWVGVVTPVPAGIAKPLVGSLIHEVVCKEHDIARYVPDPEGGFVGFDDAVRAALEGSQALAERGEVDADRPARISASDPQWAGRTVLGHRDRSVVPATPEQVWEQVERLGGEHGWHIPDLLWQVRGALDTVVGGVGHRRQRDPGPLREGATVDSWEVLRVEAGSMLELRSRMRVPGEATLRIDVEPGDQPGTTVLTQTPRFVPSGLAGVAYWAALWPAHRLSFAGMHRGLARAAAQSGGAGNAGDTGPANPD
ncbi:SDR family oxidoreductase [soil metagenome]